MWQLIGVDTTEVVRSFGEFIDVGFNTPNDLQVWYTGWGPDFLEAYSMLYPLFSSSSSSNFAQVNLPTVDSLLSTAAIETDTPTRLAIYEQLQYILFLREFVHMPLFAYNRYVIHLATLLDFPYNKLNAFYFYPCSFAHFGPGPFTLTSDADDPDTDGTFTLNWTEASDADNYSVYRDSSFITDIISVTLVDSGITDTHLTLNNFPSGTHYFIVEAVNGNGTSLSNCIRIDVDTSNPNWRSPIFDGLFLNYTFSMGIQSATISVSYTYISGNTFLVNETAVMFDNGTPIYTQEGSYHINNQTRQITEIGSYHIFYGSYSPYWIFSNQAIGDLLFMTVDGAGDFLFNITSETTINLPGINNFDAWVLEDLSQPNTRVLYDKATGILLNGTFFFGSGMMMGNYTMTLYATNMFGSPGSFILSSTADSPDSDGDFDLTWTSSVGANNYSIYRHSGLITEINGSVTLLDAEYIGTTFSLTDYADGVYYFMIVAHNNYGYTYSNCLKVTVSISSEIPGYVPLFIIGLTIVSSFIFAKKVKKKTH